MHKDFKEKLAEWKSLTNQNAHTEALISIAYYFYSKTYNNDICELLSWFCSFRIAHYTTGLTLEDSRIRYNKMMDLLDLIGDLYGQKIVNQVYECL